MKLVPVTDITCEHPRHPGQKLVIPGGWNAYVAEIQVDQATLNVYSKVIKREEVNELLQKVYEGGYLRTLRLALARRAQEYATMFPHLHKRDELRPAHSILIGFDPERLQATYIPFDQPGRAGNPNITALLREMGEAQNDLQ